MAEHVLSYYPRNWNGSAWVLHDDRIYCLYKPLEKIVGLMDWWNDTYGSQGSVRLAMAPQLEGEGAILIEYAVNLSEKAGYEGRVAFSRIHKHRLTTGVASIPPN